MEWDSFCKNNPIAICIGTNSFEERTRAVQLLKKNHFEFDDPIDKIDCVKKYQSVPLLIRNAAFNQIFPSPANYINNKPDFDS